MSLLSDYIEQGIRRARGNRWHQPQGASPFATLPIDVLRIIFEFLPRRSRLLGAGLVCWRWVPLARELETHLNLYGHARSPPLSHTFKRLLLFPELETTRSLPAQRPHWRHPLKRGG